MTWLCSCTAGFESEPLVEYSTDVVVTGSRSHVLTRQLDPGIYVFEVRERDIDLRASLDAGERHAELSDPCPRHGLLRTVVRLGGPARVRLTLDSMDVRGWKGAAAVRILRWPRAGPDSPDQRLLGFEALGAAHELIAAGTPDAWRAALDPLREAARHFQAARDPQSMAEAEYLRGHLEHDLLFEFEGETARSALMHFRVAGDAVGVRRASVLVASNELALAAGLGSTMPRAERAALLDNAAARLTDAGEYFESHDMQSDALDVLDHAQDRLQVLGRADGGTADYEAMRQRARARGDQYFDVLAARGLAGIALRQGDAMRAALLYEGALALIERPRNPGLYATLRANLGQALIALGEFDRALGLHTEAFELFSARGDDRHAAGELASLAAIQFRTGNFERALATIQNAMPLYARSRDQLGQAAALRLAGMAAAGLDRRDRSLDYLYAAERLERDGASLDRTRILIAGELRTRGDLDAAESLLARILPTPDAATRADALAERARLRQAQNRVDEALADLRAADAAYARLNLDFNRIDSSSALALALLDANDLDGARAAADVAVAIEARFRAKATNPEMRARFLSASYAPYEARIEVELADTARDGESSWRAFRMADAIRARGLTDRLAHAGGALSSTPAGSVVQFSGRLAISASRAAVQAALPPDTAVLAYFVGDRRSHAWLLTRRELRHAVLPGRHELGMLVSNFDSRQRSGAKPGSGHDSGGLLGSLLDGVDARRLLVLPDGPLNGLPFAALSMPHGAARELLVDRFVIGAAPSLALALRAPPPPANAGAIRVAVVSDPVYTPDDRRLTAFSSRASLYRGFDPASERLARLPYSAIEAQAVTRAFAGARIIELAGFNASVPRVIELPARELNVLHFATHAEARRDAPEQSALFLSEYAADGSPLPVDRLTAEDVSRSGLRADVVVLSGCATGDGRELRGEGVLGLTYGFLANGSNTVVASLWPVEDALTARFMQEFYGAYRATGRASDALRLAQLRTRSIAGPTVWASFVVRSSGLP